MSKLVVIENTVVRQDAFGRYCLNDFTPCGSCTR